MSANILLYSSGLGYINRGFESFTAELYSCLKDKINVTLFQGRGEVIEGAIPVWAPKRNSKFYEFKFMEYFKKQSHDIEGTIFSIPLVTHCYSKPCDIVHFSEPRPANILYHLRNRFGGSFKLLLSNGAPVLPEHYKRYDYVQVLTPAQKQEGIEAGYPEGRLFMIPYGLHCRSFLHKISPEEVITKRQQWNLPVDRSVILSVGAINMSHKRMHWLIQELSTLDPTKFFLWILGQPEEETQKVKDLAASLLQSGSYRFDVVSYTQMPEVYAVANYFTLCSLTEGFGRVYIEAMAATLPVLAHRNLNNEWILGSNNLGLLDMTKPGELKCKLLYLMEHEGERKQQEIMNHSRAIDMFDWESLHRLYLSMYEDILVLK